jgi:hypothetical protein
MDKERREKSRYPLQLNVRYETIAMAGRAAGFGRTVNVSSSGALISCSNTISEGARIRVVFEWPSLLNGTTPLQLITIGTVVRRQRLAVAIAFEGHQFRTAGRRTRVATIPDAQVPSSDSRADAANFQISANSPQ